MLALVVYGLLEVQACTVDVKGVEYDLGPLVQATKSLNLTNAPNGVINVGPDSDESGEYKYQISLCDDKAPCQGNYGSMIRLRDSSLNTCLGIYGEWENVQNVEEAGGQRFVASTLPEDAGGPEGGFQLKFQSEYYCSDDFSKKYSSIFNFVCDLDATPEDAISNLVAKRTGSDSCEYEVTIKTKIACPSGGTPTNHPTSKPAVQPTYPVGPSPSDDDGCTCEAKCPSHLTCQCDATCPSAGKSDPVCSAQCHCPGAMDAQGNLLLASGTDSSASEAVETPCFDDKHDALVALGLATWTVAAIGAAMCLVSCLMGWCLRACCERRWKRKVHEDGVGSPFLLGVKLP